MVFMPVGYLQIATLALNHFIPTRTHLCTLWTVAYKCDIFNIQTTKVIIIDKYSKT